MIQTSKIPFNYVYVTLTYLTFLISSLHVVNGENYVQEACNVTRYQVLCVKSLASYSNKAKRSPTRWARAGVSVTIAEVKHVSTYLNTIMRRGHVRGRRSRAALRDCVECIESALENAHKSLGVLRRLNVVGFDEQMSDVLTWLSAALTDEDTCIHGFEEGGEQSMKNEEIIRRFFNKVMNASYITSNALALVNKLATTGLHDFGDGDL